MKAVILAGGLGTRMGQATEKLPKPMLRLAGKTVLEHQLEALKKEGIYDFIFLIGHLGQAIEDYFGDGSRFGVRISYFREDEPLGTAGALFKLKLPEYFLLCNGDLIFSFDLASMVSFHRKRNALATLFTHPNSHPYDSTLVYTDIDYTVTALLKPSDKRGSAPNLCSAGIYIISSELLSMYKADGKTDLDRDIIEPALKTGRIFSYKSTEYVKDMGTPERLVAVERDILDGTVEARHLQIPQKAIFLDRDGTVNVHKGFITDPDDIELLPRVAEAINGLRSMGYLVIIVTNQPVIARGDCDEGRLKEIHNRLEELLGEKGTYIDGLFYCPHHPDKGFENEIPGLKIACTCRKPAPGLLLKARRNFNIDLAASYMVGDSQSDVEAGLKVGCTSVLLSRDKAQHTDGKVLYADSLYAFYESIKNKSSFQAENKEELK